MNRRGYLSGLASVTLLGLAGCLSSSSDSDSSSDDDGGSEDDGGSTLQGSTGEDQRLVDLQYREWTQSEIATVKDEATTVAYDELARNADDMAGDYITFEASVVQTLENEDIDYTGILLRIGRARQGVWGSWQGDRFLQGDTVEVWAEVLGTETYQDVNAGQRTVPAIAIADMELL